MTKKEIKTLKIENKELFNALIDAFDLINLHIEPFELDNPTYWRIEDLIKRNGYNVNSLKNKIKLMFN